LVDDPGWMPSLLLVWIGLVGTPLVLTELQVFETLPLIVAFGWVWLTFLAGSALSGTENWVRAGSLATAVAVGGGWALVWLADGHYPITGLPLFGDWTDTYWWMFGGLFLAGVSGAISIRPPTLSARMARIGLVSLLAVVTLFIPWWWLPVSNNAQYVLFVTVGLAAIALADLFSVQIERKGFTWNPSVVAVPLFVLVSFLFAAAVFWRIRIGSFTPFPFAEVTGDFAKTATLLAVLLGTVVASTVALRRASLRLDKRHIAELSRPSADRSEPDPRSG
jgi:hypothetical protein